MSFWTLLSSTGVPGNHSDLQLQRIIKLTNRVSFLSILLGLVLFVSYYILFPWDIIALSIPVVCGLLLLVPFFNQLKLTTTSRVWISFLIPSATIVVSIINKSIHRPVFEPEYFDFRIIILSASLIPFILFQLHEKKSLILTLSFGALSLALFDPLHNFFKAGYFQTGQLDSTYYYTNLVTLVSYTSMVGGVLFLKLATNRSEASKEALIKDLNVVKSNLEQTNAEISDQNKNFLIQSKALQESQRNLAQAYDLIEKQKDLLSKENKNLEEEILKKNKALTEANAELIKHNTELRQFSHAVSHNLRAPLVSLLGLLNLLDRIVNTENEAIVQHLRNAVFQLDTIVRDLSNILEIREDVFRIKQQINLKHEIEKVVNMLLEKAETKHIHFLINHEIDEIYSVKPMIQNMLFHLLSNCIKYRDHIRSLEIEIHTWEDADYYIICVTDNGLGIDLKKYRLDLFNLYKRFHIHTEGKGLGLYLVKLQCELLGGAIDVSSEPNEGTTFTVYLKKNEIGNKKILYSQPFAYIFYDTELNATGVVWQREVKSKEYREMFKKCIEQLQIYNTPNWVSDLTHLGTVLKTDRKWLVEDIIPQALKNGLKRIAIINKTNAPSYPPTYIETMVDKLSLTNVETKLFKDYEEVAHWLKQKKYAQMD